MIYDSCLLVFAVRVVVLKIPQQDDTLQNDHFIHYTILYCCLCQVDYGGFGGGGGGDDDDDDDDDDLGKTELNLFQFTYRFNSF